MKKNSWGFDTRDLDAKVRPQDDFYRYAAGGWLKKNNIPKDEASWDSFRMLRFKTEQELRDLITRVSKERAPHGSASQMIRDLARSYLDQKAREKKGLTPLAPWLEKVDALASATDLGRLFGEFETTVGGGPWALIVDQDMDNTDRYVLHLTQSGLGMPDRDYYLRDGAEFLRVRRAYEKHIERTLALAGYSRREATDVRETVMRIETELARVSLSKEFQYDPDKLNNPMSITKLKQWAPHIDWTQYFRMVGVPGVKRVTVMQPEFIRGVDALIKNEPLTAWQQYLRWHLIGGAAPLLTTALDKQHFSFYGKTLTGTKHMRAPWRRALGAVNGAVGELLGRLYVETYFGSTAKKKVTAVVDDLFSAYKTRITALDWMTPRTKRNALIKLRAMRRKLGYPDRWRSYKGLEIRPDDLFGNLVRAAKYEHARAIKKLSKPVDRNEWFIYPQVVNAYYNPTGNEVVFPAAILQTPFFNLSADDAVNYGAMGSVIGHEITHGFDNSGSKFDAKGNHKSWWTDADRKHFDKKAAVLVRQFNQYRVAGDLSVNGKLTLGENIADLGGLSIAFDALQSHLKKTGKAIIDGFTPEQRFFLGFAATERENRRPEAQKTQIATDPHAPSEFRVNGPLSSLPEFYEAFGVKKGDKLWREPKDRAKIW